MAYWTDKKTNSDGTLVYCADTDAYVDADGTTYPAQYPKAEIPGLIPVTLTDRLDETPAGYTVTGEARGSVTVTGWHVALVAGVPTQVWDTVARPAMTTAEAMAVSARNLIAAAQAALDKSDITITRCYERTVAVPTAWQTYRAALRAIVAGSDTTSTALPARPDYPSGT